MRADPPVTPALVAEHGLKPDEYERILEILGRAPNLVELGIFSVMWSEHCSYKSSKVHLAQVPDRGAAGSSTARARTPAWSTSATARSPSSRWRATTTRRFIEPYQGAATGVGGILRDVFTMGARPVAILDALRFGEPGHPKTRAPRLAAWSPASAATATASACPPWAASARFHRRLQRQHPGQRHVRRRGRTATGSSYARAAGVGNPVVYVGAKTGRDGIHGATMASAEFDDESEAKRPTVQVGDPFTEKLLIEACLELMGQDCIVAIQDMGAAGLTSSSFEMAARGGMRHRARPRPGAAARDRA